MYVIPAKAGIHLVSRGDAEVAENGNGGKNIVSSRAESRDAYSSFPSPADSTSFFPERYSRVIRSL